MLWLRQIGLAIGSLVAAGLIVQILSSGVAAVGGPAVLQPGVFSGILVFLLGWLIYRDIVRRDPRHFAARLPD